MITHESLDVLKGNLAKAQERRYNFMRAALIESFALAPKVPPFIFSPCAPDSNGSSPRVSFPRSKRRRRSQRRVYEQTSAHRHWLVERPK
jgi:hypothetical protein